MAYGRGMKVILLLLVSWSLTAWSEQPLTTEEFTQLRLKSYERVATKYALLLDDKETGFEDYCDKEFAAAENANDPIFDKPDWPEKIAERVMEKYFRRQPKEEVEHPKQVLAPVESTQDSANFASGNFERFSTKDHAKSNGLAISLKYPKGWVAKEGERPHIVQKFISGGGGAMATMLFRPLPLPPSLPQGSKPPRHIVEKWFTPEALKETLPADATFIAAKSTKIDGLPAGIIEYAIRMETAGGILESRVIEFVFVCETTSIQIACSVSSNEEQKHSLADRMAEYLPVFNHIANSIVVETQWR